MRTKEESDDPPEPFDIEGHQEESLRAGGRRDALWEFLEDFE